MSDNPEIGLRVDVGGGGSDERLAGNLPLLFFGGGFQGGDLLQVVLLEFIQLGPKVIALGFQPRPYGVALRVPNALDGLAGFLGCGDAVCLDGVPPRTGPA